MNRLPLLRVALLASLLVFTSSEAWPHPLAPSSLRLWASDGGEVEVLWRIPSSRPIGQVPLAPILPAHCVPIDEPRSALSEDRAAIEERWRVDCGDRGLVGSTISIRGISSVTTNVVVEITLPNESPSRGLLHRRQQSFTVTEGQQSGSVFVSYLRLGVEHLLTGTDHVIFVLGLLILIRSGKKLVQAVTAFTLGHSFSLCLSALGILRVPQEPVEIAIALSIMVLALDIARSQRGPETSGSSERLASPGPVARRPWALCTAFGLLHGLGFAGALAHAGLPDDAIPLSLLSFNVGIELGQLLIVALGLGLYGTMRRWIVDKPFIIQTGPAYIIGSLAAFWVLERSLAAIGWL